MSPAKGSKASSKKAGAKASAKKSSGKASDSKKPSTAKKPAASKASARKPAGGSGGGTRSGRWGQRLGAAAAVIVFGGLGAGGYLLQTTVGPKGAGYHAKMLCSGVFVAGRDAQAVLDSDLARFWYVQGSVDAAQRTATSSLYGFGSSTAVYREGLGCTLARGTTVDGLRSQALSVPARRTTQDLPWPTGDVGSEPVVPEGADAAALTAALDAAFREPYADKAVNTRAVVVLYQGRVVAERYAAGFDADTPLLGWSMTKSVTATLIGLAQHEEALDVSEPAAIPAWGWTDARKDLTVDHLLRMSSGLGFSEVYGAFGDATQMLFVAPSAADYAATSLLAAPPDTVWSYSSGTTNLLQARLRDALGERYPSYARTELFDTIGMQSAVLEPDASGVFVGSSFGWATARDWARFGLLHLNDGLWEGERVLPEGWVDYVTTPTPPAPMGQYGAQWWLNAGDKDDPAQRRWPTLPTDAFDASGFEGQNVLVVPSRDVVIVRLGLTPDRSAWDFGVFAAAVLDALPDSPPASARQEREQAVAGGAIDTVVYLHRGEAVFEADAPTLPRQDVVDAVAEIPSLSMDPTQRDTVLWDRGDGSPKVALTLEASVLVAQAPDEATVRLLLELADLLDARLTAEHGAHIVPDDADPRGFREVR